MDYEERIMKESRCPNSGALLFHPGPQELEHLKTREENQLLKEKVDKLEKMVMDLLEKQDGSA